MPASSKREFQSTTVRLPRAIYERAKTAVKDSGAGSSFNEFVVRAIENKLQELSEAEIDAAFAHMAADANYRQSSISMTQEFEKSDWEALQSTGAAHEHAQASASKTRSR
jgi:predicted DNA-binding protein